MIAAIYARKSNEQNGVADESKSVTRQISMLAPTRRRRAGSPLTSMCMQTTGSPALSLATNVRGSPAYSTRYGHARRSTR